MEKTPTEFTVSAVLYCDVLSGIRIESFLLFFLSRMANYAERQRATGKAQSPQSQTPEILIFLAVLQDGFSCL